MAAHREITIFCDATWPNGVGGEDHCLRWTYGYGGPYRTEKEARLGAKAEGWRRRDGKDLCPNHVEGNVYVHSITGRQADRTGPGSPQ